MAAENIDKTPNDDQNVSKDSGTIDLKKPMTAGRYHEVLAEMMQHKTTLEGYAMQLNKLAEKYPDGDEQKSIIKLLESISWVTDKAFTELYNLYRSNATLKIQVEILKEILFSIPEVKNNERFMRKIREEFDERHTIWYDTKP